MTSKRNRIVAVGLAVVVFLLGFVSGVGVGPLLMGPPRDGPNRHGPEKMLARYQRELGLSAEQSAKVGPIVEARFWAMAELFETIDPKAEEIQRKADQELRGLLNPEQQKRFDEMTERFRERRAQKRQRLEQARQAELER
ncbi:MAG TPA: hypothetical protein DFS52_04830 [Myxococcales bacterium]|nr:hypothetical protein [Myxococcales bacterium]